MCVYFAMAGRSPSPQPAGGRTQVAGQRSHLRSGAHLGDRPISARPGLQPSCARVWKSVEGDRVVGATQRSLGNSCRIALAALGPTRCVVHCISRPPGAPPQEGPCGLAAGRAEAGLTVRASHRARALFIFPAHVENMFKTLMIKKHFNLCRQTLDTFSPVPPRWRSFPLNTKSPERHTDNARQGSLSSPFQAKAPAQVQSRPTPHVHQAPWTHLPMLTFTSGDPCTLAA